MRLCGSGGRDLAISTGSRRPLLGGPLTRIRRTGYLAASPSWSVGENIAWGSGTYAQPKSIVKRWMNSPGHRANILKSSFRDLGVGIARGVPVSSGGDGATYNTDFGRR